jgi:5-methylthioadenosine/S-adenosylhomocysteine deaminase
MFEEMKICSLIAKIRENDPTVVNVWDVLEMATIGGARALGLEKEIGSLEVGKKADIILVDMRSPHLTPRHNVVSHLVYAASGADVTDVICDGKIIMRDRELLTLEEDIVLSRAQAMATDLVEKAT